MDYLILILWSGVAQIKVYGHSAVLAAYTCIADVVIINKLEIVITFLAILELIKTGDIRLTEDSTRDDFTLEDNAA